MLKNFDIINKLSDVDKIRILCDINALSDKNYRVLGIPEINTGELSAFCGDMYPSPKALSNTWDTELVGKVADDLFKVAASREMGFVKVPEPRVRINPNRITLSEDPYLGAKMAGEYLGAAERSGIAVGVGGFGIYADELEWLDDSPDQRFIYEYIVKPYMDATRGTDCSAVFTEPDVASESYGAVNSSFVELVSGGKIAGNTTAITQHVTAEKTVSYINRGGLFFEGSALALESALSRHNQILKKIDHGNATVEELQDEILSGRAVSVDMINEALDRLLDFVFKVKRKPNLFLAPVDESLAIKASERSVVLLKNNSILPLKGQMRIGLIGDVAMPSGGEDIAVAHDLSFLLAESGHTVLGVERGYDLKNDRSEELLDSALVMARSCDAVVVFLGFSEKRAARLHKEKKLSIPANQQMLLDALGAEKRRVIAVMPADAPVDVGLPENCSAILMAPIKTKYCAKALQNVLTGVTSPSGKLANSIYFDTEQRYLRYKTRRMRDGMSVGPFIGYRYYDFADTFEGFPFGHGLGYTKFTYSSLSVAGDTVSFTVKNDGQMAGAEIAQLYVGFNEIGVIRPLKELCGFARVELEAGEKKTVTLPLDLPAVYVPERGEFVKASGKYTVYVGSSVRDIRLTQTVSAGNVSLEYDGNRISDYIYSESNIISDNFKLEAKHKTMKKSIFNIVAGAVAIVFAIVLKLYCAANGFDSEFFDLFCIALGICGIVFFVREAVRRNKIKNEENATLDRLNEEMFNYSEKIPTYDAEKMFVDEFDTAEDNSSAETEEHVDGVDVEYLRYIDREVNFASAAAEFEKFAAERGCKIRSDAVKKIFAALAASRLVVVNGMNDKDFKELLLLLGNYFESPLFMDYVDHTYTNCDRVLFRSGDQGTKIRTNINFALESAKNNGHSIYVAGLTNVTSATLPLYFSSFVNYVKNPTANNHVTVLNERNTETSYYLPKNLWFILNLAGGESAADLPDFVSEVATVNMFEMSECAESEQHTPVRKFSYYQLDWLTERTASKLAVDEDLWKKIDRFEEQVASHAKFHIGNKLWLCLERYAYVYMACGGEQLDAVDEAVAAKLIVPVMSALKGVNNEENRGIEETIEAIFGEERAEACKRIIKACESDSAKAV